MPTKCVDTWWQPQLYQLAQSTHRQMIKTLSPLESPNQSQRDKIVKPIHHLLKQIKTIQNQNAKSNIQKPIIRSFPEVSFPSAEKNKKKRCFHSERRVPLRVHGVIHGCMWEGHLLVRHWQRWSKKQTVGWKRILCRSLVISCLTMIQKNDVGISDIVMLPKLAEKLIIRLKNTI